MRENDEAIEFEATISKDGHSVVFTEVINKLEKWMKA
jgi:hypothetical protein